MPEGMTVPSVAKGTRSPTSMLKAPQPTWSAEPSPGSTSTSWMRWQVADPGDHDPVEPLPRDRHVLHGEAEVRELVGQDLGLSLDGSELTEPGEQDLHHTIRTGTGIGRRSTTGRAGRRRR